MEEDGEVTALASGYSPIRSSGYPAPVLDLDSILENEDHGGLFEEADEFISSENVPSESSPKDCHGLAVPQGRPEVTSPFGQVPSSPGLEPLTTQLTGPSSPLLNDVPLFDADLLKCSLMDNDNNRHKTHQPVFNIEEFNDELDNFPLGEDIPRFGSWSNSFTDVFQLAS